MENITLDQFIAKHELLFSCRRVDSRADGMMDSPAMRHFRCSISNPGVGSFGLYFSQGSAHTENPTLADVLDCLASDASGYEHTAGMNRGKLAMFCAWCDEYGYDTDSRKAEKTFRAIKRQAEQLKRTLGQAACEELLWNTKRL
jgi:hypothetical protein